MNDSIDDGAPCGEQTNKVTHVRCLVRSGSATPKDPNRIFRTTKAPMSEAQELSDLRVALAAEKVKTSSLTAEVSRLRDTIGKLVCTVSVALALSKNRSHFCVHAHFRQVSGAEAEEECLTNKVSAV